MHLGLRLLFAFVAITGVAALFVLRVFVTEIKPSVAEVMEDTLVDAANLLAEVASPELHALANARALPSAPTAGVAQPGLAPDGVLAQAARAFAVRELDVQIGTQRKTSLGLRVLVTDTRGQVVFDSGTPSALGQDYSRWRDVARTLRGEYGARMSRDEVDPNHSVMHVAAPVRHEGHTLGALVLAKPMNSIAPFVQRAERKVLWAGVLLLGMSLAIGVGVTLWTVRSVRQLQAYALRVADDDARAITAPRLPGELGQLASAMEHMRRELDGRQHLEHGVRALTHELKSPLTAIRGAAELLQDDLPRADQQRFVRQVDEQALRLQGIVEHMLELTKLEAMRAPPAHARVVLAELCDAVLAGHAAALQQRQLRPRWVQRDNAVLQGDERLLRLAWSNLLANACAHAPAGSELEVRLVAQADGRVHWSLRDHGPGVPEFALPRLGERFFSTASGARGSGLGLAIVRRVAALHGGEVVFAHAAPGLSVSLRLPTGGAPPPTPIA